MKAGQDELNIPEYNDNNLRCYNCGVVTAVSVRILLQKKKKRKDIWEKVS